jgi:hypothetical protein
MNRMLSTRVEEALSAVSIQLVLIAFGALFGALLGGPNRTTPLRVLGVTFAAAGTVTLLVGAVQGQLTENSVGFVAGAAVLLLTVLAAARLPRIPAIAVGVLGGLVALQAATVSFVLAGFSSQTAPREHASLWLLAATTGLVKDTELGARIDDSTTDLPLWVQLGNALGPLLVLLMVTSGFALAYVVRRGARRAPAISA